MKRKRISAEEKLVQAREGLYQESAGLQVLDRELPEQE
jgi:hypothetical protein